MSGMHQPVDDTLFAFRIYDTDTDVELFRVTMDGAIVLGPAIKTMDEASLLFWKKLQAMAEKAKATLH